jgi:hypothetical protein
VITYKKFIKEQYSDIDPYGEEIWDDSIIHIVYAVVVSSDEEYTILDCKIKHIIQRRKFKTDKLIDILPLEKGDIVKITITTESNTIIFKYEREENDLF